MDVPASREDRAHAEELEALVRALEDENARLSEAQTDAVLLGVLADQVQRETGVDGALRVGVERLSVLKDLPVALACVRDGDRLVARAAYVTAGEDEPHEVVLSPDPAVLAALEGGPVPLSGVEECAAARLGAGALPGGIVPRAVLLVPFASRALGRGAFVLADDRSEVRLVEAAAVLARGAEFVLARVENLALAAEVARLGAALQARAAEDDRQDAQRMESIGRLAGGIAHELNNLLTTVLGVSEALLAELPEGGARDDVAQVREAGRRAATLTRQLLAFSRKQRLEVRPVQLEEVLRASVPMIGRIAGEDVEVRLDAPASLPPVLADPTQLEQILMNLAVNARDAMPSGGRLAFALAPARAGHGAEPRPSGYVRLAVTDTGEGMPPEDAARVLEPFYTAKGSGRGTGLGLATVYGIVTQHGGSISVRSAPGSGTTFEILLPATEPAQVRAAAGEPARAALGRGETVLVVDDEPLVRRAIGRALKTRGYTVVEAGGGEEALAVLSARGPVDLLLTDVAMPGIRGPELVRAFEARCPGRPALLMSGYPDAGGGEAPEGSWLEKPIAPEALARAVRDALDRAMGRVAG